MLGRPRFSELDCMALGFVSMMLGADGSDRQSRIVRLCLWF